MYIQVLQTIRTLLGADRYSLHFLCVAQRTGARRIERCSLGGRGARSLGSSRGALFRNRLLDLLLADGLQLLVLRGVKNFLQLRCALIVDGPELLHFLHWRQRTIVLDRLDFWTLFLEDRQHLNLLLGREFELLR